MKKDDLIREILTAVNAGAESTKGTQFATKKADGEMFFSLAFLSEKKLKNICKKIGIKI